MRILVVGSGGREHALAWKIRSSPLVAVREDLLCVPGNPGMEGLAVCLPAPEGGLANVTSIARTAAERGIDLTVVGPEAPLTHGLVDALEERGLRVFGPRKAAALLEASKVFAKEFMTRHGIPTAPYAVFTAADGALAWLAGGARRFPLVVKADGLAAGKGVVVARDGAEAAAAVRAMMVERRFGAAGERVVIEDCLSGVEVSFFALCDGARAVPFGSCQDHKRLLDGERGPNTGGMGACSPAAVLDAGLQDRIMEMVVLPAVRGMAAEGRPYRGVLYAGLMLGEGSDGALSPMVLEFNVRLGDPEAEVLLPRLAGDLVPLMEACAVGGLSAEAGRLEFSDEWGACVVAASRGYPERPEDGHPIDGLQAASDVPATQVFHAGTRRASDGEGRRRLVTAGGRVLAVTSLGADLGEAMERAYTAMGRIEFEGMHYRRDIGRAALGLLAARRGAAEEAS